MADLWRSALYLPASNPRAIAKARALPCDVVILDLEDAVAPDEKVDARAAAVAAAEEGAFGDRLLVVRVNGRDTPWGEQDLAAIAAAPIDAVLVPKVDGPDDVHRYAADLRQGVALWAMVETCRSVFALDALAAAAADTPLSAFVLGTNDLAKEMGARPTATRAPFLPFLSFAVAAARAHGLAVLDGVWNAIDDTDGFANACAQSVEFGCDGRTLIHPSQIAACNRAFTPAPDEVARAAAIVEAFALPENEGKGALRVGGAMAELLHLTQAQALLVRARACEQRDAA